MSVNLSEIKAVVNRIIAKLQDDIEISGMEGDLGYVEVLETELVTMTEVKEQLEGYQNTSLSLPFLLHSLKVASPSLDLNYLMQELEYLIKGKERERLKLERSISEDKSLLEKLKSSLVNPQTLPNTKK